MAVIEASAARSEPTIDATFDTLLEYGESRRWIGYDPYDALRSPLVRALTFGSRWPRIGWTQLLKRSPLNLRPLLFVSPGVNPKGLALVARGLCYESRARSSDRRHAVADLLERLDALRSHKATGAGWGYNFDWQSRAFFVPAGTPSIVCTSFVGNAYLEAYRLWGDRRWLVRAREACDFILADLNRTEGSDGSFCFSYTALDTTCVHNASLLGAELLARVSRETGETDLADAAIAASTFSVRAQRADGSWPYGDRGFQSWIDSFHTGFVLVSLDEVARALGRADFDEPIARGLRFYTASFFLADGTPKYYHNEVYPIDVHSAAQALVTFAALSGRSEGGLEVARRVFQWAHANMRNTDGAFAFQRHRRFMNRTSYIRWSQAWMVYGMARLMAAERGVGDEGRQG